MTKPARSSPTAEVPKIEEEEVLEALLKGGYPLEVRVFETLLGAGLQDVRAGVRVVIGTEPPESAEVDVVGSIVTETAAVTLVIECKNFSRRRFVGFPRRDSGAQGELMAARVERLALDGYREPADAELRQFFTGTAPGRRAISKIYEAPLCVQHAIAFRKTDGKVYADKDAADAGGRVRDSLDSLVRLVSTLERTPRPAPQPSRIRLHLPVMVLQGDDILLVDASKHLVEHRTKRASVPISAHHEGKVATRIVEVVTENALPRWIDTIRSSLLELDESSEFRSALAAAGKRAADRPTVLHVPSRPRGGWPGPFY